MAMTMYTASVPVCIRMLGNLSTFLDKAEAFCIAKKVEPSVLLAARLAPDMLPLSKQIHIACDASKFAVSRIIGMDAPEMHARCPVELTMARAARDRLAVLVEHGVTLHPRGRDRYRRLLAVVLDARGRDVATVLVGEGLARPYGGRGRRQGWCGG